MTAKAPRGRWFGTLKLRLMLASTLVIAASVALTTLAVLHRVEQRSQQAVMDLERETAERMASLLSQRVVGMQRMLRASATGLPVLASVDADVAAASLTADAALATNFSVVFLAGADGRMLALHDGNRVTQPDINVAEREYFKQTLAGGAPRVSAPLQGRYSNEPIIQLTMPVSGSNGQTVGVLCGTLRLASRNLFDDLTYAGSSGENRIVTIVTDAAGTIISHPDRSRVMHFIGTEPGLAAAAARWARQGHPVEPLGHTAHEDGHFVSMAGVPGADWIVFRVASDAELTGGLVKARTESLQWAAGVALLGGLLLLGLLALLLGPLSRLRQRALALNDSALPPGEGWPQADGEIGELSSVLQNVLQQRALGEHARHVLVQRMGSVLAAAPIGIAITQQQCFELVGAEFCALLGWEKGQLTGHPARDVFASHDDYDQLGPQVSAAFATGRPYFGELQFRRRDGSTFWGRLQGRPVDAAEAGAGTIWLLEDITEHRETRERLSWSASHDTLTRLLNRAAFEERLTAWLAHPRGMPVAALLFIDLDRFKAVNDSGGHAAGDGVLRDVAALLHGQARASDAAARLGGDEFALLLPGCSAEQGLRLAERLRSAVATVGAEVHGQRLTIGASIGVVEIDAHAGADAATWLARADAACYDAKRGGRDLVRLAAQGRRHTRPIEFA